MTEILLTLIRAEKKQILLACYMLNSWEIIDELVRAAHRGVEIKIIVDSKDNKGSGQLKAAQLPFCEWSKPQNPDTPHAPKMHNKFFLFTKNIFDNSLLVTGSANCTFSAQDNEENIIVTNNINLIRNFAERFNHLLQSSACYKFEKPPIEQHYSQKDLTEIAPEATRLLKIIRQVYEDSKQSAKRSVCPGKTEADTRIKQQRYS